MTKWGGWADYLGAVYMASEHGIIDKRLEPLDGDSEASLTNEQLDRIEQWADTMLASAQQIEPEVL